MKRADCTFLYGHRSARRKDFGVERKKMQCSLFFPKNDERLFESQQHLGGEGAFSKTINSLDQGWANYGSRDHFTRPAGTYKNINLLILNGI